MLDLIVECELTAPKCGLNELINLWDDWMLESPLIEKFPAPVFTQHEVELIRDVRDGMNTFCEGTPPSIEDDQTAIQLPQWKEVVALAKVCLCEMLKRGYMSEDEEQEL